MHPSAPPLPFHEPGVPEDAHVVADGGMAEVEGGLEFAGTKVRAALEHEGDDEPVLVCQGLEPFLDHFSIGDGARFFDETAQVLAAVAGRAQYAQTL